MKLVPVRAVSNAVDVLYELLLERPTYACISHEAMPSRQEHSRFVKSHPFVYWYLIKAGDYYVGSIEVTERNEIGIAILKDYQGAGLGIQALQAFLETHEPLPAVPAIRNGHWLANISVNNEPAKAFFRKMAFTQLQETWIHE